MKAAITTHRPRLVIVRPLGLGDFLTGVPAYRALARAFPNHHRILAAPISLAPLAQLCGDCIDEVVDTAPLAALDPALHGADVAVNLHGRGPQSHRLILETEPRRFIAFENNDVGLPAGGPKWRDEEHEVLRWCRMLNESGVPADPRDLDLRVNARPGRAYNAILLHPGASSESRRWPVKCWIELATELRKRGYRLALTGNRNEFRRCRVIARNAGLDMEAVLAGHTSLEDLAAIVAGSQAVICGDTGMAHVATAVRTPSVVLFGPMSPARWGPPRERTRHRAIWHGRVGDPHAATVDPGLAEISVKEVVAELESVLEAPRAG